MLAQCLAPKEKSNKEIIQLLCIDYVDKYALERIKTQEKRTSQFLTLRSLQFNLES